MRNQFCVRNRLAAWPLGRLAAMMGGVLLCSSAAQAEWIMEAWESEAGSATTTYEAPWSPGYNQHGETGQTSKWGIDPARNNGVYASANDSALITPRGNDGKSHHIGSVRARFHYSRNQVRDANNQLVDDPNDPVPATLNVLIKAAGTAEASDGGKTPEDAQSAARYGGTYYVTDPAAYSVSVSILGQSATPTRKNYNTVSATTAVKLLQTIETQGQATVFTEWHKFEIKADVTGTNRVDKSQPNYPSYNDGVAGYTYVKGEYDVQEDNRSVEIRGLTGMDGDNWRKGLNGKRELNVRNSDGFGVWDSVVTWHPAQEADYQHVIAPSPAYASVNQLVFANTMNFSSDGVVNSYKWDILREVRNYILPADSEPYRIMLRQDFDGTIRTSANPRVSNINVAVTDSKDGAVAQNGAIFFWHLPYEENAKEPFVQQHRVLEALVQPQHNSFSMPLDPEQTLDIATGLEGIAGAAGAVAGTPGGPAGVAIGASLAAGVAGLLELKWKYAGNNRTDLFLKEEQWTSTRELDGTNGKATWQDDDHMAPDAKSFLAKENGSTYLDMGLLKVQRWTRQQWKADHYEENGFESSNWRLWANVNNSIQFEPYWKLNLNYADPNAAPPAPISNFGSLPDSPETDSPDNSGGAS